CAHYDHLGTIENSSSGDSIYNGARDNGMGVVSLLTAAKILSANLPARSVIFAAFTGEEEGMRGSKYLIEHPPFPLDAIAFVLNNDGGGYNDTTLIRVAGLKKTTAEEIITKACISTGLTCLPYPKEYQYLYDLSDNAPFAVFGIPAVTISPGFSSGKLIRSKKTQMCFYFFNR
ncbi:M20/M25/M40 family metallo-hydrolase, partial [Bacteroidota bacterium]